MNVAHWHLILNHIPIIGMSFVLAFGLYALFRKKKELQGLTFIGFIFIALMTWPTYFTGEEAEDMIEDLPTASEHHLEHHEEIAEWALISNQITGFIALIGLIQLIRKKENQNLFLVLSLLAGTIALGVMIQTANIGGQIQHQEIRKQHEPH